MTEPESPKKLPFLAKLPIVILNLLFLFPVGLYFMWKYEHFNKPVRIIITVLVISFAIYTPLKRQGLVP